MALSLNDLKAKISKLPGNLAADVHDVISHPQFLTGLLAGPEGPLLIAEAHRSGALGKALGAVGLGNLTTGKGPIGMLGRGGGGGTTPGGDHADPGSMQINTKTEEGYCWPGGRKPFPLIGRFLLTAGAQTQGTDLGDFHAATSNPTVITNNGLIPGNVRVKSCRLSIGVKMLTTLGAETTGFLEDMWVIERVNGTEIARWSFADLGCTIDHSGITTSGNCSAQWDIAGKWQKWERTYDPTTPHALAVQLGVTTTTVQAIDFAFIEAGERP